jgi:hypothetical protein
MGNSVSVMLASSMCGRDVLYAAQVDEHPDRDVSASNAMRTKLANPVVAVSAVRLSCFFRILCNDLHGVSKVGGHRRAPQPPD